MIDINTAIIQVHAAGEQAQDWQSLWRPSSAPHVQQSGTSCVLVHETKGVAVLAKAVGGTIPIVMHIKAPNSVAGTSWHKPVAVTHAVTSGGMTHAEGS